MINMKGKATLIICVLIAIIVGALFGYYFAPTKTVTKTEYLYVDSLNDYIRQKDGFVKYKFVEWGLMVENGTYPEDLYIQCDDLGDFYQASQIYGKTIIYRQERYDGLLFRIVYWFSSGTGTLSGKQHIIAYRVW